MDATIPYPRADRFRETFLEKEPTRLVIQSLNEHDFERFEITAVEMLNCIFELVEMRRRTYSLSRSSMLPITLQRYHTLQLQRARQLTASWLAVMRGLPVRLEVTGLNYVISQFFVNEILEVSDTPGSTHVMKLDYLNSQRDQHLSHFQKHGLKPGAAQWLGSILALTPGLLPLNVIRPGQSGWVPGTFYEPGMFPDTWNRGGMGVGAGPHPGGIGPGVSFTIPIEKGVDYCLEEGFWKCEDLMDTAIDEELLFGLERPDGTLVTRLGPGWPPTLNWGPWSPKSWATVPEAAYNIGTALMGIGAALISLGAPFGWALVGAGAAVMGFGYLWDKWDDSDEAKGEGTKFVDP